VLRFPIANDPLYNSEIFGPRKGKGGELNKTHQELIRDLIANHSLEKWIQSEEFKTSRLGMLRFLFSFYPCVRSGSVSGRIWNYLQDPDPQFDFWIPKGSGIRFLQKNCKETNFFKR